MANENESNLRLASNKSISDERDDAVAVSPSDVINQLHQELIAAQSRREEAGLLPLFEVESLEIEMNVTISATRTQSGKLDIRLLAITRDTSVDKVHTQTIRLKLHTVNEAERSRKAYGSQPNIRRSREAPSTDV